MKNQSDRDFLKSKIKDFQDFGLQQTDVLIAGRTNMHGQRSADLDPRVITLFDVGAIEALQKQAQDRPVSLEVGFGKGRSLLMYAKQHPDRLILGVEVRRSLCNRVIKKADKQGLENIRLLLGDSREMLPAIFPKPTVDEVFLLFPDPWWKHKHARRRYGPAFFTMLAAIIRPGGLLVIKSDVKEYLDFLNRAVDSTGRFRTTRMPVGLPWTNREVRLRDSGFPVFESAFSIG